MPGNTLHLSFVASDQPNTSSGDKFVISEDLDDGEDDWFGRLNSLQISQNSRFSYDLFWPHLVQANRGNLLIYVKLYSQLSRCVESENIEQITTHNLQKGYRLVVDDLSNKHDLDTEHYTGRDESSLLPAGFLLRFSVLFLFVDQLLSIVKERIASSSQKLRNKPLFLPYPGRYGSMLPIIRDLDNPSNIVVTPLTMSWRVLNPEKDWPENHDTRTLTEFASWSTIWKQLSLLFHFQKGIIRNDLELTQELDNQLQVEYGVSLPRTTEHVCQTVLHRDIRLILSLPLLKNAIEETEPSAVIVGGMNPRDRYALEAGENVSADLYYLPHSIAYDHEVIPQITETTHFVAGEADERVLENNYSREDLPDIQPVGRPYLDELSSTSTKYSTPSSEPRIIIGTQPYANWIREKFIEDVLSAVESSGYSSEVVVKIHPSETTEYYETILSGHSSKIRVETGDIRQYIDGSTILITINSNVGIEGILMSAFCISYNPFEPFVGLSSYIDAEYVPYITNQQDLQIYLEKNTIGQLSRRQAQREYLEQAFSVGDSVNKISGILAEEFGDN